MIPSSTLVIGCSDQLPNELHAYHLVGYASTGAVLLTRRGTTYSAKASDVSAYQELLESMLSSVLRNVPAPLQTRAREGLIKRWNRDWGVEAGDPDAKLGRGSRAVAELEVGAVWCPVAA